MNSVLKTRNCVSKTKGFVFKTMNFAAWRDGLTVLSEIDREDLIGMRIDVETFGKGYVEATGKGRAFLVQYDTGTQISKKKIAVEGVPTKVNIQS